LLRKEFFVISKRSFNILRWLSLILVFLAVLATVLSLIRFSRIRNSFPPGMKIAGVPVGGLDQQGAAERLIESYGVPIEIHYEGAVIQIKPLAVGFELDLTAMLAAADLQRINQPFWEAFWAYLWDMLPTPGEVPLIAKISEDRLKSYLRNDIATRYDLPAEAAKPIPGSVDFQPGKSGTTLDVDRAVILISDTLRSPTNRVVNLSFNRSAPTRPSLQNLQVLLQQIMDIAKFDGVAEIYLKDLQTQQELNFAYQQGSTLPPAIAFTAASTMKIPIMVSTLKNVKEPLPKEVTDMLELMIERSENDPADRLMEQVMDKNIGPLYVTDNMTALGLNNTFLAGYFYPGAPLLKRIKTTANSREDINTEPDVYNQTTPAEMGMLLDDIYQCSLNGGGAFAAVFPGELTQAKCKTMIDYLVLNKIGVLIQAGLPDGTRAAHKHGWITEGDGVIHTIGDAGIVYSPGGNFILTIYLHHPVQLVWEPSNLMVANLASAVYNYFNLVPAQAQ
jgi:hypothetical protein